MRCACEDHREAALEPRLRALCDYAVELTRTPGAVAAANVHELRAHGWDDRAIHDAIQVIAYFNYVNRVAQGVGIGPEPEWPPDANDEGS